MLLRALVACVATARPEIASGAATARLADARGFRVVAGDLADPAPAVEGLPHEPLALRADVTDPSAMIRFAQAAAGAGEVAVLVYAAGIVATMPIDRTDWNIQRRIMAVNLDGAFFAAGAFASVFQMQGQGGAAVFVSSIAGWREAGASAYCASKFGLIGLVESLAAEWAPMGVRTCAVAPGNVDTPMLARVARDIAANEGAPEAEVWERIRNVGAARRLVSAEEVAETCLALASPGFSGVTGVTLTVDAGAMVG